MGNKGGEAGGVRGVAELGFAGCFENFVFDDVFCLGSERSRDLDVGLLRGGGLGLKEAKGNSSGAALGSGSV